MDESVTGPSLIAAGEKRLAEACMKLGLTPQGAGVSAFVNGIVAGATLQALVDWVRASDPTFDELWLKVLIAKAESFESAVAKPKILGLNGAVLQ